MFRVPVSHAIRSARRAASRSESASLYDGRAVMASSCILDKKIGKYGDGDSGASSTTMAVLAALAAAGIGLHGSSPVQAEAEGTADERVHSGGGGGGAPRTSQQTEPLLPTAGSFAWKPFGGSSAAAKTDLDNAVKKSAAGGKGKKEASDGGGKGGDAAADAAPDAEGGGDKGGDGDKLGLRLSAMFVREALKDFRNQRATMRVLCPPVDFRLEKVEADTFPGKATLSASFYVPRSANILRVLSTMVSPDQTMEVKQPALDKTGASIAFCEKDRTGSLLVRHEPPPGRLGCRDSVHLYRDGGFTKRDLDVLIQGYQEAWSGAAGQDVSYRFVIAPGESSTVQPGQPQGTPVGPPRSATGAAVPGSKVAGAEKLRQLGVEVYDKASGDAPGWDSLAGYEDVKQEIEDTLVMPLRHPEVFDVIARKTRTRFESNRPRAVLFEGPPGTGKTLSARIIAGRSDRPMVHVPVEGIMSKWYGESEKKLSAIFDACDEMGGAIIFIDEVDALAGSRSKCNMHEATRRILSVILQKVEGFEKGSKNTLICATNRKDDLDSALLSRFQLSIRFGLPDAKTRREVFALYARQLSSDELETLASISGGMSCRDMKETCQHAERRWASKIVRGQETEELPSLKEYVSCVDRRSQEGAWQSRPAQA